MEARRTFNGTKLGVHPSLQVEPRHIRQSRAPSPMFACTAGISGIKFVLFAKGPPTCSGIIRAPPNLHEPKRAEAGALSALGGPEKVGTSCGGIGRLWVGKGAPLRGDDVFSFL